MSEFQITRWHQIPSMIIARNGEQVVKIMLPTRFQEAIDEAAMRMGKIDADAYTSGWVRDPWVQATELPQPLADRITEELEAKFSEEYLKSLLDEIGTTPTIYEILANSTLVSDGAMGTMLQERGLTDGGSPELWNVDKPEAIEAVLEEYASSGARLITTNTFGGTRGRLAMHGLEDRVYELNKAGAEIAKRVATRHPGTFVMGDIGPTGDLMEPMGILTLETAKDIFAEQIRGLADGGVDAILIETMSDLTEVEAAVNAANEIVPDMPVIATMSFDTNLRTMMGVKPAQAVEKLVALGVRIIGANCGRGMDEMRIIAREMVAARPIGVYIIAQSNAGLPTLVGDTFVYQGSPQEMAIFADEMLQLGVNIIGSCCGSTPAHTAAITEAIKK